MGPLTGIRIIELASIGPGPFCGMMLSDMGAEVIRIDRIDSQPYNPKDALLRNRKSVAVDLKHADGAEVVLHLVETGDGMIEGFRPGVAERLGLGPETCLARNPQLVYGRVTGWGQSGPLAQAAGHDINYIALTGVLHAIGESGRKPVPPLNLIGDFGGGGMLLAFGMVCALLEARSSGEGQVVDAAMVDGASALMALFYSMPSRWHTPNRGENLLDGGAPFYGTYETSDGKHVSIGAIEPEFFELLIHHTGADKARFADRMNRSKWPELRSELARIFKSKTLHAWCEVMEATDACFAPVLSMEEAPHHPHNKERKGFVTLDGVTQPAPAPRFGRTHPQEPTPAPMPGSDTGAVLSDLGLSDAELRRLRASGAIGG